MIGTSEEKGYHFFCVQQIFHHYRERWHGDWEGCVYFENYRALQEMLCRNTIFLILPQTGQQ